MSSPTIVNVTVASAQSTASASLATGAMANAVLFHDTLVIAIEHAAAQSISSISDTAGNTYTKATGGSFAGSGAAGLDVWTARIKYPLNTSDTITVTPSASTNLAVNVMQLRGAVVAPASGAPYDQSKVGSGAATNSPTTGASPTLAVADELSLGFAAFTGNTTNFSGTDSTGYTSRATIGNASGSIHVGTKAITVASPAGTETYNPTLANSPANSSVSLITLRGSTLRYVNISTGSDAATGITDFTHAKLTIAAAGALVGDVIHIAKTTTPTASAGTSTWTTGSTTVSTTSDLTASIAAKDLVSTTADGSGGWWEVSSITATTITLVTAYRPGTNGLTGSGLSLFALTSAGGGYIGFNQATNILIQATGTNGTQDDPVQVIGGINTSNDTRDGFTWMVNTNATRQGFFDFNKTYNNISYLGVGRPNRGFQDSTGNGGDNIFDHCQVASSSGESFYKQSTGGKFLTCIVQPQGNNIGFEHSGGNSGNLFYDTCAVLSNGSQTAFHLAVGNVPYDVRNCQCDGTTGTGFLIASRSAYVYNCTANNTATGFQANNQGTTEVTFTSCVSSNASSRDFQANSGVSLDGLSWWFNCLGNSSVVATRTNGRMIFDKYQQTNGDYRFYDLYGAIVSNTAQARSGTCVEFQPGQPTANIGASLAAGSNSDYDTRASRWVEHAWPIPIESGGTRTVSVYVRKTTTWNGFTCLLGMRANGYWVNGTLPTNIAVVVGTGATTILSTTYQQYTFTYDNSAGPDQVIDLCLQLDGSAGSVYVDDVTWT